MRQALHIFTKDIRYLRYEIALALAIDMVFAGAHARGSHGMRDSSWAELALVAVAAFLVGRLVLAEAIPGDRQFWITRPYRWQSLLGAKLLFIVAFVNLPILLAHLFILIVDGFPLAATIPGLFWTQFLLLAFVSVPVAALATLMSGMVPFIFSQLVLFAAGFTILEILPPLPRWLSGVEWVAYSIALIVLGATASMILFIQYKGRRTWVSRWFALSGIAVAGVVFFALPWPAALAVQSHFSKQPSLGSSIQIALGHGSEQAYHRRAPLEDKYILNLPLSIEGIPDGAEIQADALMVSLESPDGRKTVLSPADCPNLRRAVTSPKSAVLYAACVTDMAPFIQDPDQLVTLHASLYFTLFGNARSKTIPLSNTPSNAVDGLQCFTDVVKAEWDVYCRSAFRWPARLVYAKLGDTNANSFTQFVSYSPFPATLNIEPVETRWASAFAAGPPLDVRYVTIVVKEPLVHLRRDIDLRGVSLNHRDFVPGVPPQSRNSK